MVKNNERNPKSNSFALGIWQKVWKTKHSNEFCVPKDTPPPFSERRKADAWRDLERGWNISAGYCRGEKSRQRERATVGRKLTRRGSTPAVHVKPKTSLFELWLDRDHISNSRTQAVLRKKKKQNSLHWLLVGHIQIFMKTEQGEIGQNLPVLVVIAFIKSMLKESCSGWFGSVTKGPFQSQQQQQGLHYSEQLWKLKSCHIPHSDWSLAKRKHRLQYTGCIII